MPLKGPRPKKEGVQKPEELLSQMSRRISKSICLRFSDRKLLRVVDGKEHVAHLNDVSDGKLRSTVINAMENDSWIRHSSTNASEDGYADVKNIVDITFVKNI